MPEKAKKESQEEQSERFRREAQRLIDAGELSPADAEVELEKLMDSSKIRKNKE